MVPDGSGAGSHPLRPWPPLERTPALDVVVAAHAEHAPLSTEAIDAHFAPDVLFTPPPTLPGAFRPYFGRRGVREWLAAHDDVAAPLEVAPRRYAAAGERVVVIARVRAGAGTREFESAWLWTVRGGRVTALRAFRYASEALARLAEGG